VFDARPTSPSSPSGQAPGDPAALLPARFPVGVWVAVVVAFLSAYGFLFTVVHPFVDTRPCVAQLPDPIFRLLAFDTRWYKISHELFYVVTVVSVVALVTQAVRGEHRPMVRFAVGVSVQALLRSLTMALLPLCKVTVAPGTAARTAVPTLDLGFAEVPWLTWATNDLVFSGHVGEFLILSLCVWRCWPRPALAALVVFQILEALALVITRGHYTVDIVIAIPFAWFADRLAVGLLGRVGAMRRQTVP
jgi:hypothetical protein